MQSIDREVRQDIAEVLVRYATGIDRRDWALLRSCFTDDCEADYGDNRCLARRRCDHRVDGAGAPGVRTHAAPHHQPGDRAER